MLQSLYKTLFSKQESNRAAAARATNDVKLFEAVFESMPQLYVQMIVLLHYNGRCAVDAASATRTVALLYTSISISVREAACKNSRTLLECTDPFPPNSVPPRSHCEFYGELYADKCTIPMTRNTKGAVNNNCRDNQILSHS